MNLILNNEPNQALLRRDVLRCEFEELMNIEPAFVDLVSDRFRLLELERWKFHDLESFLSVFLLSMFINRMKSVRDHLPSFIDVTDAGS